MVEIVEIRRVHKEDIKDAIIHKDMLITAGRDRSIKVLRVPGLEEICSIETPAYANSLCALEQPGPSLLFAGLQNGSILEFEVNTSGGLHMKKKHSVHKENVSALRAVKTGFSNSCNKSTERNTEHSTGHSLKVAVQEKEAEPQSTAQDAVMLSCSWDGAVCIWRIPQGGDASVEKVQTEKSIWAAEMLDNGRETVIAGSTDGTVLYLEKKEGGRYEVSRGIKVHKTCIRDVLPCRGGYVSVSNTGVVIESEYSGRAKKKKDFDSISFRISFWEEMQQYVVSSDEGVVRVLEGDAEQAYVINVPTLSCWHSVPFRNRLYILGSDGRMYVFSASPPNTEEEKIKQQEAKNQLVSLQNESGQSSAPAEQAPGSAASELEASDPSNYKVMDGKVYERKGDSWELFGSVQQPKKKQHSISIELGGHTLPLSFDDGESHLDVANGFIVKHRLSPEYTQEIVEFLDKNFPNSKTAANISGDCAVYSTISVAGVSKKVEMLRESDLVIQTIEDLERNELQQKTEAFEERRAALEVVLSEWMGESEEKYPVLDCYKYFVAKGMAFDFIFLKYLNATENRKDAHMFMKLATNLLVFAPETQHYFLRTANRILDKNLVPPEIVHKYKKNLHKAKGPQQ